MLDAACAPRRRAIVAFSEELFFTINLSIFLLDQTHRCIMNT